MTEITTAYLPPPMPEWPLESDQINELVAALCAASKDFAPIVKRANNPHLKSQYADLDAVIDATRPALAANGLVVFQTTIPHQGIEVLETKLAHTSGQWKRSLKPLSVEHAKGRSEAQDEGAILSYHRRYQEMAILNLAAEDTDGQRSPSAPRAAAQANGNGNGSPPKFSPRDRFLEACKGHARRLGAIEKDLYRDTLRGYGYEHAKDLPATDIDLMRAVATTLSKVGTEDYAPDTRGQLVDETVQVERAGGAAWAQILDHRKTQLGTANLHTVTVEKLTGHLEALIANASEAAAEQEVAA